MATALSRDEALALVERTTAEPELAPILTAARHVARQATFDGLMHEVLGEGEPRDFDPFADNELGGMRTLLMIMVGVHLLNATPETFIELFIPTHQVATGLLVYCLLDGAEGWQDRIGRELFENPPTVEEVLGLAVVQESDGSMYAA